MNSTRPAAALVAGTGFGRGSRRGASRAAALVFALLGLATTPAAEPADPGDGATLEQRTRDAALDACERSWQRRADQLDGDRARPEITEAGLAACLEAGAPNVLTQPVLVARWKALRAAHYLSAFTRATESRQDEAIRAATELADASIEALERTLETKPTADLDEGDPAARLAQRDLPASDIAQLYFWTSIVWGAQGQRVGLLTIVREGVAKRIYENANIALRFDPTIERGGAYRLLSRLHADLPRVPFVSGWVDRDEALPLAEAAFELAPEDPGNKLILALALRERAPERSAEASALLSAVAGLEPRPALLAEDLAIREQARELLDDA